MKTFWCHLKNKMCKYGGNKSYNYGFMQGTSGYCYYSKKWTSDMKTCPLKKVFVKE